MITTLLMAMVPVIELRGAIPYGVAVAGLEIWQAALIAVIGNLLPIPFLVVFTRDVFAWMRKKSERLDRIVVRMEKKADKNKDVVLRYQFWGLMILVAIPLPGTGAWTGAGCSTDGSAAQEGYACYCAGCSHSGNNSNMDNVWSIRVFVGSAYDKAV